MILKMEKLSVFGLLSEKDAVVSDLMRARCIQLTPPETMEEYDRMQELTEACSPDVYEAELQLGRYTSALSGISYYTTKPGLFAQKPRVLYDSLGDGELMRRAEDMCGEVERVTGKISDLRTAKSKDTFLKTSLEPWLANDLPLEETATIQTSISRYLLPAKTDISLLEARQAELAPAAHIEIVSTDREQQYAVVICHKGQQDGLWEVLKEFGAARASFPGLTGTAADNIRRLEGQTAEADAAIAALEDQLRDLCKDVYPLKYGIDNLSVQIQQGKAADNFRATGKTFCFTAWVAESGREAAIRILEAHGCHYELREVKDEEEPPILLKNGSWATPYESITEMYSLPVYRCMDPNRIVSIFYFVFFGMMLSDAGFGLVLFLGGLWFNKKMDLGPGGKKLVRVITMGGLSAVIWGTIFGSWFGDLIPVVADTFFGIPDVQIFQLIDPLTQAVLVMGLSMAMGFVHILVGMGCKAYLLIKRGHPWEALFDVGFWYMVLIGLVLMLVSVLLPGAGVLLTVGSALAIAGAVGLILTQGREAKNPVMKILNGITSLYDVTGYFSDVLSYSRILALGLATGVIAQVCNIMGSMAGGGIVGAIVFILVFLVGGALNLGINTLGTYVHTARLQYVEFFGKFYEAGGKPFAPLAAQTKYIVVTNKEEL